MADGLSDMIQMAEFLYRITRDLSAAALKMYHVLYYAKHDGQTSFRRLSKVSDSIGYLEINTQDEKSLRSFLGMMDKYKILYSQLPDLNISDGRTQIAFDFSQSQAVNALLNLVNTEKLEKLQQLKNTCEPGSEKYAKEKAKIESELPAVSFITADDYALTRLDKSGKETPEYNDLEKSARENLRKEQGTVPKEKAEEISGLSTKEKVLMVKEAKQAAIQKELLSSGKAEKIELDSPLETEQFSIGGEERTIYRMKYPEGSVSVIIPESNVLDEKTILIEKDRDYRQVSSRTFEVTHVNGSAVISELHAQAERSRERENKRKIAADITLPSESRQVQKGRKR